MLDNIRNFLTSLLTPKYRAQGIDGARYWGSFKPELAKKPVDFIIIKATEGTSYIDTALQVNWEGAKQIPVRGMYHYQRHGMSWLSQAEFFLRTVAPYDIQLLALDVEEKNNEEVFAVGATKAADQFFSDTYRIIELWRYREPTSKVLLYTSLNIYQNYLAPAIKRVYGLHGVQWLEDTVELWLAVYNGQGVDGNPTQPSNRTTPWRIWQYSSNGRKEDYGTQGDVDLNVFNGTKEELYHWVGNASPPPVIEPPAPEPEPETELETWTGRVIAFERLTVRSYPLRVGRTDTGDRLYPREPVRGKLWKGNGYVWMKLDDSSAYEGKWIAVRTIDGDAFVRLDPQPTTPTPPPTGTPQLWKVKHDAEMGDLWRTNVPEVFRLEPLHAIPLNREWQLFIKDLNPTMEPKKWRVLLGYRTAFTNNASGYDRLGDPPKQDWVNRRDTNARHLPSFDQPRICGGAIVTGRVEGDRLWLEYLDASKSPPSVASVKLWQKFCATNVTGKGISRFPQGGGADVWIPLIARQPISIALSKLERLDMSKPLPNPYGIYK